MASGNSLSLMLDDELPDTPYQLNSKSNEKGSPFNKIFQMEPSGVNLDNLIDEIGTSDTFYSFELPDYVQDEREHYEATATKIFPRYFK